MNAVELWSLCGCNTVVAAVLASLAAVLARRGTRPQLVHAVWLLVLLKLVTPPLLPVVVPTPRWTADEPVRSTQIAPTEPDEPAAPANTAPPLGTVAPPASRHATEAFDFDWSALLLSVWLAGTLVTAGLALFRALRFTRLLRQATPAPPQLQAQLVELGERLGLRRLPALSVVSEPISPLLWAMFGKARIVLPAALDRGGARTRTLLAHELIHYARRDHWVRLLELVVRALHWWNPLVYVACRGLRTAEELCCDTGVVHLLPGQRRSYADALLDAATLLARHPRASLPAPASGVGPVHDLERRLDMIMSHDSRDAAHPLRRALHGAALACAALTVPLVPAFAQGDPVRTSTHPKTVQPAAGTASHTETLRALRRAAELLRDNDQAGDAKLLEALRKRLRHDDATRHGVAETHRRRIAAGRTDPRSRHGVADPQPVARYRLVTPVGAPPEVAHVHPRPTPTEQPRSEAARVQRLEQQVRRLTEQVERLLQQRRAPAPAAQGTWRTRTPAVEPGGWRTPAPATIPRDPFHQPSGSGWFAPRVPLPARDLTVEAEQAAAVANPVIPTTRRSVGR